MRSGGTPQKTGILKDFFTGASKVGKMAKLRGALDSEPSGSGIKGGTLGVTASRLLELISDSSPVVSHCLIDYLNKGCAGRRGSKDAGAGGDEKAKRRETTGRSCVQDGGCIYGRFYPN